MDITDPRICRFHLNGYCWYGERCRYIHSDPEDFMGSYRVPQTECYTKNNTNLSQVEGACALSPSKLKQNVNNETERSSNNEPSTSSVEESLAILSLSEEQEKTCGICFDVVLKKTDPTEQFFGILPNCNHCFCFACLTRWRQSKEFDLEVSRACPECRIASDFVYRTRFWLEKKEEKTAYIDRQKMRMKQKDCKYFKKGNGNCPFGNTCMFLHALPNGQVLDVGPPEPRRRRRATGTSADDLVHQIVFWLNDEEELDFDTDDEDEENFDSQDPCIAFHLFERGDITRYFLWDRLMRGDIEDDSDRDINPLYF